MTQVTLNQDKINELMNERVTFNFRNYDEGAELPESAPVVIEQQAARKVPSMPQRHPEARTQFEPWRCDYIGQTKDGAAEFVTFNPWG